MKTFIFSKVFMNILFKYCHFIEIIYIVIFKSIKFRLKEIKHNFFIYLSTKFLIHSYNFLV